MECVITTVRGISSSIDTIWKSDGVEIKRTFGASISSSTSSSILYRDFYISLLTTAEDGSVYQCEGVINTSPSLNAESSIILDVIGMLTFTVILFYLIVECQNYPLALCTLWCTEKNSEVYYAKWMSPISRQDWFF